MGFYSIIFKTSRKKLNLDLVTLFKSKYPLISLLFWQQMLYFFVLYSNFLGYM